jgi:hypothetical protein
MTTNVPAQAYPVSDMERMAKAFAASKLFGVQNLDQALALMLVAQAEGRHPASAAQDYNIIQGRPAKKADAMLRDFLAAGGKVEWHALTDETADATFSHPSGGSARIDWTVKRANAAGISNPMWKKYPRQMLRSRTVSEGVRTVCPGATSGMYVPEEVQDIVSSDAPKTAIAHSPVNDAIDAEFTAAEPVVRKSSAAAKRDGDDVTIKAEIGKASTAELIAWREHFDTRTAHLPNAWLDSISDMIDLRSEELHAEEAGSNMDEGFRAAVG